MKIKNGYILRKLGSEYMVVPVGEAGQQFNGMIRMNAAGAWLWERLKEGTSKQALVQAMCANYEGLDAATAEADLNEFLQSISMAVEE